MTVTLGMSGTGRWTNEERPKSFREGMLKMFPNGDVSMTAFSSKGKSRRVKDPEFKYYSKDLAVQGGTSTGCFTTSGLGTECTTQTPTLGTVYYVKCAEAVADDFREGHTVLMVDTVNSIETFGKASAVVKNGASSYIAVTCKKTGSASDLAAITYIDIIGNANAEGANVPDAISYDPDKFSNYTQIFRTPLDITRTQMQTQMRIGDTLVEAQREILQYHGVEVEMAGLFGEKTEGTGSNGQKERTTQGAVSFLKENYSTNVVDYAADSALTWKQGGEDWLDEKLEQLFRFGSKEKLGYCGSLAILGIMKLVKQSGSFQLTTQTAKYGVKVMTWVTPFGEIHLKHHPLFTYRSYRRNNILLHEPGNVQFSYLNDTMYKKDPSLKEGGHNSYDGRKDEYLTEAGWEFHFPKTMMWMSNVGVDG